MKKTLLVFLSFFAFNTLNINAENGTENDPFLISTKADLIAISTGINGGSSFQYHGATVEYNAYHQYFKLANDIYFNEMAFNDDGSYEGSTAPDIWSPIGFWDYNQWEFYSFQGTLEGDGHTIYGLYCNDPAKEYVGFFGVLQGGIVKNLRVSKSYFCGKDMVGGIAGDAEGLFVDTGIFDNAQIINCIHDGVVRGETQVGGIAGLMCWADALNCVNIGKVFGGESCGGIAGFFRDVASSLKYCLNAGEVNAGDYSGGIAGLLDQALIESCLNVGLVVDKDETDTLHYGAIAGGNALDMGAVRNCFYDKQACPIVYGVATDSLPGNEGYLTRNVVNGSFLVDYHWIETNGLYPIPAGMFISFNDVMAVAAAPMFLAASGYYYEKVNNVNSDFTVSNENGVIWEAMTGNLTINGNAVTFNAIDEDATLKVSKGDASRIVNLFLNKEAMNVANNVDFQMNVYPNPATDFIKIECEKMGNVTLTDVAGHVVISETTNSNEMTLDLTLISKGFYFLIVGNKVVKIVKQ